MSKIIKVDQKVSEAKRLVNNNMKDVTPEQAFQTLVVGKETEKLGKTIFSKSKNYIESNLEVDDVEKILTTNTGKKLIGEFESYETLFGVEFDIGGFKWKLEQGTKKHILETIDYDPDFKNALLSLGIIKHEYSVNYNKLHNYLNTLSGSHDLPVELVPLSSVVTRITTDKTVTVSPIKAVKK